MQNSYPVNCWNLVSFLIHSDSLQKILTVSLKLEYAEKYMDIFFEYQGKMFW